MNSPEELAKNSINALNNPHLLYIAETSDSPSTAEKIALDEEYPLSLVKETRLLAVLKRDHPQAFNAIAKNKIRTDKDYPTRIFPCYIKNREEFDISGELHITPHSFLPPLFWDYQIYLEDGDLLFSCDASISLPHTTEKYGVECILSVGSKSLPVGLNIKAEKNYGYGNDRQLTFERKLENWNIKWVREIPRQRQKDEKDFKPVNSYERMVFWNDRRQDDRIILRNLGQAEKKLYGADFIKNPYYLFLASFFHYPAGINSSLLFKIQVVYDFGDLYARNFNDYSCGKIKEFPLPAKPPMWFNMLENNEILISTHFFDENNNSFAYSEKPIQQHIGEIVENTPSYINGLAALWNYFSFKNTEPYIYNDECCKMLPPWEEKKE